MGAVDVALAKHGETLLQDVDQHIGRTEAQICELQTAHANHATREKQLNILIETLKDLSPKLVEQEKRVEELYQKVAEHDTEVAELDTVFVDLQARVIQCEVRRETCKGTDE